MKKSDVQKIIARMHVLGQLLEIETGVIGIYTPPPVDDTCLVERLTWDMYVEGKMRYGATIALHRFGKYIRPSVLLARSFAHVMIRSVFPSGQYEAEAEQAYKSSRWTQRKSSECLLNDVILLEARDIMLVSADDECNPEDVIPSAEDVLSGVIDRVGLLRDIEALRTSIVMEVKKEQMRRRIYGK
jgi:hypothetical protein